MNQESKRFFQFQQRFSIRKFKVGVASVAISTMAIASTVVMGQLPTVHADEFNRTGTGNSTVVNAQEFVMVTHEKPGGIVEDVAILKSEFSENLDQLKKDYPGFTATSLQHVGTNTYKITYTPVTTTSQPSSTPESVTNIENSNNTNSTSATANQTQPTTENRVSLQGHLVGNQTEYNVGEQIISTFRLDVSAPSKLEEGSYILVNLPANEPITDVQIGTALRYEKVTDTQYKIYTGEVPSGSYGNFNISYKFDKYRTGRNSQTSITSQLMDKYGNPISPEKNTKSVVANTNKSGYASIHVDSESGARDLALFNTNAPGDTIDETKNKELVLKLTTLNKEVAAVNKIQHAITLPTGALVSKTSINAGWTQEGNIARYTRNISDAKTVFDQGNNTSDDTLRINMRQTGTLEEFLKGKEFTFTDNVTYTDKSGETNTSQGSTSLVVKAVNPYKNNGGGATPNAAGKQPPLVINNYTNEQNHENRVNIAIPGISTETDDKRIIAFWRSVDTPTKVKEVELTIDSDFDQKRSIEFYGTWNKNGAYAAWYAPDNLGTSNTFEVYTVNGTTETKLGEIAFKKNGGTSIDLPEGTTKVLLRPKGEMTFTNDTLSQAGIYLHQNLKGLEKAKQMVSEGKEAKSIVTAKISTQDTDVVNTSVSKTILADARTALKLTSRTEKVEKVFAGNKTPLLSSGIEAYDYSPSGLGNRVYGTTTSHGATTDKKLDYLGAKNAKIIVELPDGFSYAGNSPLVTKDDNYQNTGKRVLIIDPKDSNTRENVTPNLEFNVAQWVQTGTYRLKYTLVWDENRFLHGLNPNNEFDGDKKIINTSTFTYEIPVSNTSGTRLHVDVTDKNDQREGYTTSLKNLAPKADVTYRFTLSNTDNSKLPNNEVLVTLPKKGDKNIVDTNINRNSAFDVEATGEAIASAGWTAYYSTSPITGNANEVAAATTLTADQVTDWSKVTAVKFVSNPGTTLNPGLSNEFLVPARISKDAKDTQVAYISAAAKTNAEEIYNEANVASVTIKTENIKTGSVKVAYEDMQGNTIKPTITAIEKRAYTKDYNVDTEEYRPDEFTYNGIAYRFMKVKETSAPVEGVINSEEITVTYVYDTLYENVLETKTITRTIKYVDANDEATEVSPKVVQTVTLTRTNKRNKVTNTLEEGTWTTGSWAEQASPSVANYGTPDQASVSSVAVTPSTENTEVVVKYPQAKEDEVETKVITRTIKYVDASNETTEVSPKVVQTVTLTRTNKRNKVTNTLEEGTWTTGSWAEQASPSVANYGTPDQTSVSSVAVTPSMGDTEVVVKYPQAKEDEVETKVITRTIKYVDASNETTEVSPKVVQTVTLTRTNKRNKVTNTLEEGTWTSGSWAEQASPSVANYGTPDQASVSSVAVTPSTENTEVVVKYPQAADTKTVATKQTVTYEGAGENTPAPNEQTYYTFTGKTNKVTNVTTWNEETHTYGVVTTPKVEGYYADKAQAGGKEVTPTNPEASDKVVYKPLGKVILVDEGGNEIPNTPKPTYKNNPNDLTVGGETPIPEIPEGYEIKPKQDVPGFNPEGKVVTPPKPGEDTRIVLVKLNQKATVRYVVEGTNTVLHKDELEGKSGEPIQYTTESKLAELKKLGYELVTDGFVTATDKNFDNDSKVDQDFLVIVAKTVPVTPTTPQNPNEDPKNLNPGDPIDPKNPNGPKWTKDALDKLNNIKSVTRTITYVKDGTTEEVSTTEAPKVTNKVSFTRTVVVNPKDGSVVGYDTTGDGIADVAATDTTSGWTAAGTAKFGEVKSPVVKGYVVKPNQDTQGDLVEADGSKVKASTTDLTVDSANQDLKVRYVPVGTWTPKVPEGETPINPIPYPNDPKDPGKIVDPNNPTDPKDPNKPSVPVVPHIPGTTPKDPNGNPLKPVDPKDPSKGYVPPTPKTPTEHTEIKYEKDTQKAVTKFEDLSGNPIPGVNNIEETGKSGEPLTKATEVTTEIAKLIAKGYDLVSNNYGKDNNGNFDKDSGKDQEYTVVLTPHVESIKPFDPTNPNDPNIPKPGDPIDPKNPDGPKWTKELIDKLNTTKHVTRTITYVDDKGNKVEYTDKAGNKSTADVADKVTFTRTAKINVVTGTIEYGNWTPVNNDTTFDKVTSPVVPGYVLKDASQKEVAATENLTENSKDENIKVVYVPVGKLVPKVPEGVTPPTPTPYDNVPGEPGKVVPPSPTKPTDPQDPNSPKVPVIPHIPGTTPQVPKDPTKPVDPNTNPLVPLEPVTSGKPEDGYKVPPVPTNPDTDTPIYYVNDKQKAITNFVDNNNKPVSDPVVDQGDSGSKFTKSGEVESKIKDLVKKGYVVTSNDYPSADTDRVFDKDKDKDQIFNVKVTPLIVPTDPNSPDKPQVPTAPTKPVGPNNPLKPVTPSTPEPGKPVFPEEPNSPVWPETVKDLVTETSATRTITYVDQNGKEVAATHSETIKFKRSAKVNLVTGDITYGDWTVVGNDTILDGNKLPKVDGYIARGGDIESSQKDVKATAGVNITETVVYDKLGSWIPKLPEGQNQVPPTPYPNDPTDPTKPGTDKPRVLHVPGFIPVDPEGQPLKPVDPNDPTKGYEVPDVPADPTKDTPIKYVPVKDKENKPQPPQPGPKPTPAPQPAPAPKPEPNPETPKPVTPADNGSNNGNNNGAPTTPDQPVAPSTPQYMDGQRELPNTGTEDHASLAALGLLGALSGFGLIARKKREDEEQSF